MIWLSVKVSNTKELKAFLEKAKADIDEYAIFPDVRFPYETMGYITPNEEGWEIGICERGVRHHQKRFNTEAEACQRFVKDFFPEVLTNEK